MSNQYRKKPVVIDAIQFDGTLVSLEAFNIPEVSQDLGSNTAQIPTLEGVHTASKGDWIIKGIKGEFYPCKPDIFAATYEPATAPIPAQTGIRASVSQPEQARAWFAVCEALDRVSPDWLRDGVPAMDSAVTAIEGLAARQAPDPSLLADLSVMLAALIPSELAKQMNPQTIERLGDLKCRVDASVNGSAQREPAKEDRRQKVGAGDGNTYVVDAVRPERVHHD